LQLADVMAAKRKIMSQISGAAAMGFVKFQSALQQ
jgi:hypothetical protein